MTVLAPAIGGSVGNATYQLARAQGAGKVISTAGSEAKAARARELGFEDVVDPTTEGLAEGVRRMTAGKGVDIVIESIGGTVTSEALSSLGLGGVLITLGYSAERKTTIDVTDLIWKRARMAGFSLFAQSPTAIAAAWRSILPLIVSGSVKPVVERVYPFGEAGDAGISLEVCAAFPAITAIGKGLDAYVAVDASGTFSETKRQVGLLRMLQAGVILSDYATLMVEILKDNARPEAGAVYGAIDMPWAKLVGQIAHA